ncbi:glutaredoxin domain-containing protein [Cinnamomum micranthum f. kanehirae]|uniref:Glutaredoxin domain-containing protein n=1 Tax=Cinnamomum micranthum f. kanehirae TaxID=337451 RepID=A0A443PRD3_9MAGN|nr:glutaredoxin domain-containing protein [Cinnamomum micranthum f. kanehirae]
MGCGSSKRVEGTVAADVYRPAPTSIALFDVNTIEEPWLISTVHHHQPSSKPISHVPAPILEKLDTFEIASDAPYSWSEVSKALQHLKPSLQSPTPTPPPPHPMCTLAPPPPTTRNPSKRTPPSTRSKKSTPNSPPKKKDSPRVTQLNESAQSRVAPPAPPVEVEGIRPLRENSFIVRDRLEKEGKAGSPAIRWGEKAA